jgi:hypothetical protein
VPLSLLFEVLILPRESAVRGLDIRNPVRHSDRMTNDEDVGTVSVSTGFATGMLMGIAFGIALGLVVFENMAIGLALGAGTGGVLGVALVTTRRSQRGSS